MGELFEVCDFIVDFVLWVHVVSKEQATHIIVHHLARLGQVTQNLVNALLEMVLQLLPHDVEECHSVLKKETVVRKLQIKNKNNKCRTELKWENALNNNILLKKQLQHETKKWSVTVSTYTS